MTEHDPNVKQLFPHFARWIQSPWRLVFNLDLDPKSYVITHPNKRTHFYSSTLDLPHDK